jgi:hypothetical protein
LGFTAEGDVLVGEVEAAAGREEEGVGVGIDGGGEAALALAGGRVSCTLGSGASGIVIEVSGTSSFRGWAAFRLVSDGIV